MSFLQLNSISKTYTAKGTPPCSALQKITYSFEIGKSYAITGPSGSGKSTLLHILAGLTPPTEGELLFDGQPIYELTDSSRSKLRNRKIGFIVQDYALLEEETVLQNCMLSALLAGKSYQASRTQAEELLDQMGLLRYANQQVYRLSGGERQRTAIVRAMMNSPKLLLADEPTGALDSHTTGIVMDELLKSVNQGTTLILATHNPVCAMLCQTQLFMRDGRLIETENDK